jgi:uncharacterized protein
MKIFVKAKAGSKENKIVPPLPKLFSNEDSVKEYYTVFVKEPPKQGKANEAIVKVLAEYFKVSKNSVSLVSGVSSKKKVFEIIGQ